MFSVIILTHNEARNLPDCLASLKKDKGEVFVVDSGSSDDTVRIATEWGATVIHHPFENYAKQRNWTLDNLPLRYEWVLNLDADHRMTPELWATLEQVFANQGPAKEINGFLVSRQTHFLGKWIRYGAHYPVYHTVLFRRNKGRCEDKQYDQHFKVEGKVEKLHGDIIDIITDSLSTFTERHNRWASLEAEDQVSGLFRESQGVISGRLTGNPIQRRRYLKSVYERFPLFVRPFIYFFIRYFLRLGFLDGRRGLIFHFLQGFWFRFLVDAKIYELRRNQAEYRIKRQGQSEH